MSGRVFRLMRCVSGAIAVSFSLLAAAESNQMRIGRQVGLGYLQTYVMQAQKLVEKYAKAEGIDDLQVTYQAIRSPSALNDGILSGNLDFVAAGVPPFIVLYDRTVESGNPVKMVGALGTQSLYLVVNTARIKTLKDFQEKDRIAVPAIKTSTQAIILGIAAQKLYGPNDLGHFDSMGIGFSHPDAVIALLSGSSIVAHFSSIPFQTQELANPKVHKLTTSNEILGGPASITAIWGPSKYMHDNPKLARAMWKALNEATEFIKKHPDEAARIYMKIDNVTMPVESIVQMLVDPEVDYTLTPQNLMPFADFMYKAKIIHHLPKSWKDMVFPDAQALAGS